MSRNVFWFFVLVVVYVALAIGFIPGFLAFNFGEVKFDQVLFFLTTEDGTMGTDRLVLLSALQYLVFKPLTIAGAVTGLGWLMVRWLASGRIGSGCRLTRGHLTGGRPTASSMWSRPRSWLLYLAVGGLVTLPVASAYSTLEELGGVAFFARPDGPDQFARLYVTPPADLGVTGLSGAPYPAGTKLRNLVFLYVESLETTFSNTDYFGVDLNAPVAQVFDQAPLGIEEMAGTNWTMAGMVASQCAVPLATFIWNKAEFKPGAMLGNARCLGDYLKDLGYEQHFLVGPELKFSGMDKFYLNHGYQRAIGKQELLEAGMPPEKLTGWGGSISDDTLLDLALEQILALHAVYQAGGQPFNVTVITTDNHAPNGYLSPRCPPSEITPAFARVIDCTNRFVARFYEQLRQAGVLKDTVFVVMGDHLFMNNPEQSHHFPPRSQRQVYFNYRSPDPQACSLGQDPADAVLSSVVDSPLSMTHFDVAPTVLALVTGTQMAQMGLGDNLCLPVDGIARQARHAELKQDIASHSQAYRALW